MRIAAAITIPRIAVLRRDSGDSCDRDELRNETYRIYYYEQVHEVRKYMVVEHPCPSQGSSHSVLDGLLFNETALWHGASLQM
jgi:hypothetical protein